MKNTKKKGFTLVELVIVIAVIAILAAVLIPTFTSVIQNANASKKLQELKSTIDNEYIDYVAKNNEVPKVLYYNNVYTFTKPTSCTSYTLTGSTASKTFVKLDSTYNVYLLWDAVDGSYSIEISSTAPTGYTSATETTISQ